MSLLPLLMRMLLCLSLVLNGTGPALASAAADAHPGGHNHAAAAHLHAQAAAVLCHDAAATDHASPVHAAAQSCMPAQGDCCEHGDCRQACHPQHSPAASPGLPLAVAMAVSQDASRPLATSHDAPLPLRLMRPPIA